MDYEDKIDNLGLQAGAALGFSALQALSTHVSGGFHLKRFLWKGLAGGQLKITNMRLIDYLQDRPRQVQVCDSYQMAFGRSKNIVPVIIIEANLLWKI